MKGQELIEEFEIALDKIPYLVFEIGYTRTTGWMVHLWNSTGVGIKNAEKIFTCQDEDKDDAFSDAINRLKQLTKEV